MVVALFDWIDLLDVTGPPEVLALAHREAPDVARYEVLLASETLHPVTTGAGVRVLPDVTFDDLAGLAIDTLVVPGAVRPDEQHGLVPVIEDSLVLRITDLALRSRRVASVCVGAHVLAAMGLLDGRTVTTHWSTAALLAADHPEITVDADPIFIRDGHVWTAAGISSCLDLTLALVADDLGEDVALRVARQLVMYLKRPGGQSQFSVPLAQVATTRRMEALRHHILGHLPEPLTVPELAAVAHVGERQLARLFRSELRTTLRAYVESLRLESARHRLETTDDSLDRSPPSAASSPPTPCTARSGGPWASHRPSTASGSGPNRGSRPRAEAHPPEAPVAWCRTRLAKSAQGRVLEEDDGE